ncbi:hypothetical protein [Bartonella vinsonii]|uniref:Uncharacterized protein n=1 Tax=Bartonella vinsonii TaxID=33047 RepID=A0A448V4Y4_BARVI|nr:hypothetical protein [Bartonella vinsonii]VEJ44851.1 Uncharacterised protein [Bartonella vinsonii]
MNLKYFITAFTTFASISVAQGAGLEGVQKIIQGISSVISSEDSFPNEKIRNNFSEAFQANFSCIDNNQWRGAELMLVASSPKRRGPKGNRGGRPSLFRGPMSF